MASRLFSLFIGFFILAMPAISSAANLCELPASSGSASALLSISCQLEQKSLGCDTYFKANHVPKEKRRSCDENATYDSFLNACGKGAGGFFSALYDSTIGAALKQADRQAAEEKQKAVFKKACEEDHSLSIKRSLEINARLEGVTRPISDEQLKGRSCESLMQAVQARANFREFQEYVDKLDSKEFRSQWDDARKKFFVDLKTKVMGAAEKAGIVLQCYNHAAQVEIGCKVASALVTGVAVTRGMALGAAGAVADASEISATDEELYQTSKAVRAPPWQKLDADQARAIIGDDAEKSTENKVRHAVRYINSKTYPNASLKADDMETLFNDISGHDHEWHFRRLQGSDGSSVFVGDTGPSVVVNPQGQMYKGLIDYKYFYTDQQWSSDYSHLDLIPNSAP